MISLLLWLTLMTACGDVARHIRIAQRGTMTFEEKLQQLVYRGASRTEVVVTLGPVTGYTHDTLSYSVDVTDTGVVDIDRFPRVAMLYLDPEHSGLYRLVLTFDENGSLYDYHRPPIDYTEERRVYRYFKYKTPRTEINWDAAYQTGFTAVQCRDTRHCRAVGGAGLILETTDGGKSRVTHVGGPDRDKHRPSADPLLYSVVFPDPRNGWASGGNWWGLPGSAGLILHSVDGGEHWEVQLKSSWWRILPIASLSSIAVRGNRQGWAVGGRGTIFHTSDGGRTWVDQPSGTTEGLNAVQCISPHQGWAAGDRGVILKTINGGQDWITQSSGTREDLRDPSFVDENHGWVSGSYGLILHTTDGGITWKKQCLVYDCAGAAAQQFYWQPWLK